MDGAREKFIDLVDKFLTEVNKSNLTSPYVALEETLKLDKEWIGYLLPAIPELIFFNLSNSKGRFGNLVDLWNLGASDHPSTLDGIVSCHALSPMGDTITFLADLGRNARIAASLGKELHIILADRDWTRLNWVVQDYGEHNLTENEEWRKKIYRGLGCKLHMSNLENSGVINRKQIELLASSYTELSRALFGQENIGKKIKPDQARALVDNFKFSTSVEPTICLLKNNLVHKNIGKEFKVIKQLLGTLRRVDQNTFSYYFAQRYHQYRYHNYLKLAVRSERNFDLPFYEMDLSEDKDNLGITKAVYFKDYILGVSQPGSEEEFVIPYYFPSGSLYQEKEKLDEYLSKVIMLDDFNDQSKFVLLFEKMEYPHNARLASDLLSFVHMYISNNNANNRTFRTSIRKILKPYSVELDQSWHEYSKSNRDFASSIAIWKDYIFSKWPEELKLPYYYYPYVVLSDGKKHNDFSVMLYHVFHLLIQNIGSPVWYKE